MRCSNSNMAKMKRNRFRIKKSEVWEECHPFPCYKVQMKFLGLVWITVKTFVEYYPDMMGYHVSAKGEAEDLLQRLVTN